MPVGIFMIIAISRASKHPYKYANNQIKKNLSLYHLQITQKVIIIYYNNIFQKIYKEGTLQKAKKLSHGDARVRF